MKQYSLRTARRFEGMKGIFPWFVYASVVLGIGALSSPLFSLDDEAKSDKTSETDADDESLQDVLGDSAKPAVPAAGAAKAPLKTEAKPLAKEKQTAQTPAPAASAPAVSPSLSSPSSAPTADAGALTKKSPAAKPLKAKAPVAKAALTPPPATTKSAVRAPLTPPPAAKIPDEDKPKGAAAIPAGQELVNMDFPEMTEIQDIIKAVAVWTGKNVILDRNVSGKVQIISPRKVTKEEAYQAFLSALNILEYTTVETGKVIKIMKVRNAVRDNLKTYMGSSWSPRTDEVITQIIPLKYIDAKQLSTTLSRIVSSNSMIPYEPTNTLIVSDSGYKVRRILEIIELLDVQTQQPKVVMVPIKYSDAKSIADKVNQILQAAGTASGKPGYRSYKILTDDRTNSVIIFGPPLTISDVKELVKKFDVALDDPAAQATIHVRPLDYADAKKLATTLSSLATGSKGGSSRRPPSVSSTGVVSRGEASIADLGNDVKVTSDEATNALLITGSKSAYNALNSIIRKLDVRRAQVFIEADILDLSTGGKFAAGTSIFAGNAKADGTGTKTIVGWDAAKMGGLVSAIASATAAGSTANNSTNATAVANAFTGSPLSVGILSGQSIQVPGIGKVTPGAIISLLKQDTNARNLQSPNILTSNNEEATIQVGQKIFYKTSVITPQGTVNNTPQKEDVDMTLTIKPNLSNSNYVTMSFQIEANKVLEYTADGFPIIAKRKTKQSVVVKNGQTVVISGLMENNQTETFQKIPLLGDIPVIGWLFRNTSTENSRKNLVIFLTPHIVHGGEDLAAIYKIKLKERDEYFEQVFGRKYAQSEFFQSLPKAEDGEYKATKADEAEEKRIKATNEELYRAMNLSEDKSDDSKADLAKKNAEEALTVPIPMGGDNGGGSLGGGALEPPPATSVSEPIMMEEPSIPPPPAIATPTE